MRFTSEPLTHRRSAGPPSPPQSRGRGNNSFRFLAPYFPSIHDDFSFHGATSKLALTVVCVVFIPSSWHTGNFQFLVFLVPRLRHARFRRTNRSRRLRTVPQQR